MLRKRFVLFILLTLGLTLNIYGQFKDYGYKIGLQGLYVLPANEFTEEGAGASFLIRPHAIFELSKLFDLGVGIGYGIQQGTDYGNNKYQSSFIPLDIRLFLSPIKSDVINPYIFVGAGGAYWNLTTPPKVPAAPKDDSGITGLGELGLGVEIALSQQWLLDLTANEAMFTSDDVNGLATNKNDKFLHQYDRYAAFGLGITYVMGSCHKDEDMDGLENCDEELLKSNPKNPDTDADGLKDGEEYLRYKTNLLKADTDGDGLKDGDEVQKYQTDPNKKDTDGDGLDDGAEVTSYNTDPTKVDTDGDGLKDGDEINTYKTDPTKADTDGDGLKDGDEVNTYKTDPSKKDTDGDGLNDGEEVNVQHTDPLKVDTDGDKLSDGDEVIKYKTNPNMLDTDKGGIDDGVEVNRKTDPLDKFDDVEKVEEGIRLNIQFASGKAVIQPQYEDLLNQALKYMEKNTAKHFEIHGYTSTEGSTKSNQKLSERRSSAVVAWFVARGIPESRIKAVGHGESEPIMVNGKEDKPASRRIMLRVLE